MPFYLINNMFNRILLFLLLSIVVSQKLHAQYTLNNNAAQVSCNEYRLTDYINDQKGSVWNNTKINLTQSFDFNFQVFLGINNSPGADGMAFVLQPISTSVGTGGGGLGFQNVSPSVGVTIDTYPNAIDNDPTSDHIAIQLNGNINHSTASNIAGPVSAINGNVNIEDGVWHSFRVTWDAATKTYTAYIDGVLRVTVVKDFVLDVFSGDPLVYWGFTASTGGENNRQSFRTVLTPTYSISPTQKKCVNEPITFTNTSISFSSVASVEWNFGDASPIVIANNPTHTYTTAGDYTVTQKVTALDGCQATNTQTIRIGSKPIAGFTNSNACNSNFVSFTDTSANSTFCTINNWYWDFDNAGLTSTLQNPNTTYATIGPKTIKFAVKSIEGCVSDTLVKTIQVNTTPILAPTATSPIVYCQNAPTTPLAATGTNLLWYDVPTGGVGSTTAPTPSSTTAGTTIYYVCQTLGSCEGPRLPITVTINATPAVPTVTTLVTYCENITATALTATGTNLLWYNVATNGIGNTTAPVPNTATVGSTIYYVSQTIGSCESPRAAITVTINATPPLPTVTTPVVYCQGEMAVALIASGTDTTWYSVPTGGTGSTIAPIPSTTTVGNTNYYVSQTINGCEGPRALTTVTVNPTPAAPIISTPISYCQNAPTIALSATGTNLLWYTANVGGVVSTIAPIPSSATAGTFTFYVSQKTGNCEGPRAAIIVNIFAPPPAPIVTQKTYCPNDVAIPATAVGSNLLWYTAAVGGVGSTVAPTPNTNIYPTTFNYYVSQTENGCESQRALLVITVDNALNIAIGNDTTICEGQVLTFNPTSTPIATSYEWRAIGVPLSTIQNRFIKNAVVNPVDTATYILKATLGGCIKEDTVIVNVLWKPLLDAGPNNAICFNDSALLVGVVTHNSLPITTYSWTPNDSLRTPTQLQTWANPSKTTLYKLTIATTVANYGCAFTISDSVKVTVQPIVQAFAGNDTIAVKGVPHRLNASGGTNYLWSSPTAILNNPFSQNTTAILNNDANFYVEVRDAVGCIGYDSVFVKVYNGPTYYVPNTFTPNGDGINDIFRAIPVGMANTTYFRVFNRLGELVFETNKWLKGWDGTFKGKPQPNGTYVWIVAGTDRDYKKVEMKGTVNLVR
jgi:gliding motility-associated-like protein